jgi:Zn-dependent peptidase ImmA (M78 family)/transcriptional regulator with XRE-family HTH domain
MARTPPAPVNPDVLRWARESAGFDIALAAKRVGVSSDRLTTWEEGRAKPTLAQLRNLAQHYRRPPAFFFLVAPPADDDVPRPPDFRRVPDEDRQSSVLLLREMRAAAERRDFLLTLTRQPAPELSALGVDTSEPAGAARAVRAKLNVALEDQFSYRSDIYGLLARWTAAVEDLGTLVSQTSRIPIGEFRGLSVYFDVLPLVMLNGSDAVSAKCFTIFHELFHLLRGTGSLCDLDRNTTEERECNQFAAEVLMPAAAVAGELGDAEAPVELVPNLARKYGVSEDAMVIRLRELRPNRVSQADVDEVLRQTAERVRERDAEEGGFAPFFRLRLRDLGRKYVGAVFEAYYADDLTLTDVAQRLRVKVPQVDQIEQAMFAPPRGMR